MISTALNQLRLSLQGKEDVLRIALASWLVGGHILIEDLPGTGKTTLAKSLAMLMEGNFKRLQFTSDILPSDLLGGSIYQPASGEFVLKKGPIFCDLLLVDEINRSSPRTQSALLEAMAEKQISLEGKTHALSSTFTVIATQNPLELEGTHPLPEAQLDRFLVRITLGYPSAEIERQVVLQRGTEELRFAPLCTPTERLKMKAELLALPVHNDVLDYLMKMVWATRQHSQIQLGISTRGAIHTLDLARALAYMDAQTQVLPEHIYEAFVPSLNHRLILTQKQIDPYALLSEIRAQEKVPR